MVSRKGFEVLCITVDIGGGKLDKISVYENDEAGAVAREFAVKHGLSQKLEQALGKNILELLKDINKEQLSMSSSFSARTDQSLMECKNYGEKMYAKGIRHKEQIEANKQLLKMQIEKSISETTSFHPTLNETSKRLARNSQYRSTTDIRPYTQTYREPEYPFAPKLNENSQKLIKPSKNRINELYEEAKHKKQRIESNLEHAKKNEFPFKPSTNNRFSRSDPQELIERLTNSKSGYLKSIEELKEKYEVKKDPETGQEFFKPIIGKNYNYSRNCENVWETLYKHAPKNNRSVVEYPHAPIVMESKARSEKIILKVKIDRYSEVFQMLNPDMNGNIVFKNINMNDVDPVILRIIMPLLNELEELNQPLNFEEFVDSMENLFKYLSQSEKDVFLIKPKKKPEEPEVTVKKTLNLNTFNNLYSRQVERKNNRSAKLEIEREKLKLLELEGCTFKPQTKKFPSRIFNK